METVVWAETEAVERVFKRHAVVKLVMVVLAVLAVQEAQAERAVMVLMV